MAGPTISSALAAQGIKPIDLVVVNLYPFGKAADNPDTPFDALVEEIDIGGPSLLRAAAKNFRDVLVVVAPGGLSEGARTSSRDADGPSLEFRFDLMKRAFMHTGQYDGMIAMTMAHVDVADGGHDAARSEAADEHPARRTASAPLRREPSSDRVAGFSFRRIPGVAGKCIRARNCRIRICWTSMRRCVSRSSSTSRRRS